MVKKRGLGEKGLGALLKGSSVDSKNEQFQDGELKYLPVEYLQRGKYQPRRDMDQEALEELAGLQVELEDAGATQVGFGVVAHGLGDSPLVLKPVVTLLQQSCNAVFAKFFRECKCML